MQKKAKPEVWTDERCYIAELVNDPAWPEFSLARTRVEPGVTTQLHALSVHEVYVIESGCGRMTIGDDAPFFVGPGDAATIPRHVSQSIENTGAEDLVFLCVCAPRFSQECYTSKE
jgi:mannose-6-phosphate isomerase-like protein (cupin superfamily)